MPVVDSEMGGGWTLFALCGEDLIGVFGSEDLCCCRAGRGLVVVLFLGVVFGGELLSWNTTNRVCIEEATANGAADFLNIICEAIEGLLALAATGNLISYCLPKLDCEGTYAGAAIAERVFVKAS